MQMRINLDQIFGNSTSDDNPHDASIDSYQPSDPESTLSFQYKYNLQNDIFDTSATHNSLTPHHSPSLTTSYDTQPHFQGKLPGERLYYQSFNINARKKQELERLKLQKIMEQKKQITFKPQINKNSQKIVTINKQKTSSQYQSFDNYSKPNMDKKKQPQHNIPTKQRKQKQEAMECTFQPKLVSKPMPRNIGKNSKQEVFDHLFNEHKMKKYKQKLKTEQDGLENRKMQKKLSKDEFQKFLQRNNQFLTKVQKKNEMVIEASSKFDLHTGNKLFSPKICTSAPTTSSKVPFSSRSQKNIHHQDKSKTSLNYIKKKQQPATKKPMKKQPFSATRKPQKLKMKEQVNQQKIGYETTSYQPQYSLFNKHEYQKYNSLEQDRSNGSNIRQLMESKKKLSHIQCAQQYQYQEEQKLQDQGSIPSHHTSIKNDYIKERSVEEQENQFYGEQQQIYERVDGEDEGIEQEAHIGVNEVDIVHEEGDYHAQQEKDDDGQKHRDDDGQKHRDDDGQKHRDGDDYI